MKLNLDDIISSPQELKAAILEVKKYARWFGQNAVKKRVAGVGSDGLTLVSQSAAALITEAAKQKPLTQNLLDELIETLTKLETSLPRVTVTLAAPPTGKIKKSLVAWFRQQIGPGVLVDFRFNSTLLGGMVVQYGSHIHDWSFRRQIMAARDHFPEILRHV